MPARSPEPPDTDQSAPLGRASISIITDRAAIEAVEFDEPFGEPLRARDLAVSGTRFTNTALMSSTLPSFRATDSLFERADCSNATWIDARLVRCAFTGCKGTGLDLRGAALRDARFHECKLPDMFIQESSLDRVWFESCNLQHADFSGGKLDSVTIRNCDATGLRLLGARITALDLRGSRIDHLAIDASAVRNIIIDPLQAPALTEALGARVVDQHEEI